MSFILYRVFFGPWVIIREGYKPLLTLLAMFIIGTFIYGYFEGLSALVALFASVSTVTIIGLYAPNNGNFTTMNKTEAILVMGLIIASVTAGASFFNSMVSVTADKTRFKREATKRLVSKLKAHVIVYGYTHMGKYVDDKLDEIGSDYVVISRDAAVVQDLLDKNVFAVLETQTNPIEALQTAGIDKASKVIVTDVNDSDNIRFILTARKLRPDIKIHTVVHDPSLVETAKDAGANVVIPASVAVGRLLAFSEDSLGVLLSKNVFEFRIDKSSSLIGKGLQEISKHAKIAGVERGGDIVGNFFDSSFTLKSGDTLLIVGDHSKLRKFEEVKGH